MNSRTKGAGGERELCRILADELGIEVTRNLSQTRDGGADIKLSPFSIEVKRRKKLAHVYEWMKQSEDSCTVAETPVVVFRADGKRWLALLNLEDLIKLIREELVDGLSKQI